MLLSQKDSNVLKGVAIICIVFHNIVHVLSAVKENEFSFSADHLERFLSDFSQYPLITFLSYFGWMGVSVFVFISGYGLSAKYSNARIKPFQWIGRHYLKLFTLLFLPLLLATLLKAFVLDNRATAFTDYLLEQTMLMNIVEPTKIWPAIYWYIGMALQLYLIFLLLRRLSAPMLIATGIAACLALSFTSGEIQSYLRHNFIGWLPEFIFGMVCFRIPYKFPDNVCAALLGMLVFAALVFAASLSPYTYYLGGLMFVGGLISIRPLLVKIPGLRRIGAISASIYVIHPLVRYVTFQQWPSGQEILPGRTALLVLALSILLAIPYQKVWTALLKKASISK